MNVATGFIFKGDLQASSKPTSISITIFIYSIQKKHRASKKKQTKFKKFQKAPEAMTSLKKLTYPVGSSPYLKKNRLIVA